VSTTGPFKALGSFAGTKFGCALALVLVLNGILSCAFPSMRVSASDLPSAHTWEWWRTRSFLKHEKSPDVVLLGSSLMMIPVSLLDADYLNKDLDAVYHDHSVYLENALSSGTTAPSCFNFAIPGGMISDDYMISRALFRDKHRPKVIVLGLTLRDFIESHVTCAAVTPSFKYFKHFFDIDDIAELSMPEIWQRLDFWQSKFVFMVGERLDLQVAFAQKLQSVCNILLGLGAPVKSPSLEPTTLAANLAHNLKTEAEPGDFMLRANQIYPYEDNSNEYRKRFNNPSQKLFNAEASFLHRFLAEAHEQNVKVLLVNMPLTQTNMGLMPPGLYAKYFAIAQSEAKQQNADFLDLNNGTKFGVTDFRDTAHMNSSGGRKLLDAVAASIEHTPDLANALSNCGLNGSGESARAGRIAGRVDEANNTVDASGAL
jgi:hypothetical protein